MENQMQVVRKNNLQQSTIRQVNTGLQISIRECKDEEIKQPIRYAMALIGLPAHKAPSEMEKTIHLNFIRDNYPDYTPDEIKFAFEKAMARKFGDEVNVECYENFSCNYIGKILAAYENWTGLSVDYRDPLYENNPNTKMAIAEAYQRFLKGEPRELYPNQFYWQLVHDGFIKQVIGPKAKRVYTKQFAILSGFQRGYDKGIKNIYYELQPEKLIENQSTKEKSA